MNEFYFNLQRFSSYVVTADTTNNFVSVTKDEARAGISASMVLDDGTYMIDLTSSLTLSSGDSLTLSQTPDTVDVNANVSLGGAGTYTINGLTFTANGAQVAAAFFYDSKHRYIYPAFGIYLSDSGIIYNGVTYKKKFCRQRRKFC